MYSCLVKTKWIVGIDEAGRGSLAGPVSVGVLSVPINFDWTLIPGVRDSKQLSPKKRETIYLVAKQLQKEGKLDFRVTFSSADIIDRRGITHAVRTGIIRGLQSLKLNPTITKVKLDGLLHAPEEYIFQETIIRGDATEPEISLASIVAKVERDRLMVKLAEKHPLYGFEIHKGYGTVVHRNAILEHGLSVMHRQSFCRGLRR